jgi:hypothetical protein
MYIKIDDREAPDCIRHEGRQGQGEHDSEVVMCTQDKDWGVRQIRTKTFESQPFTVIHRMENFPHTILLRQELGCLPKQEPKLIYFESPKPFIDIENMVLAFSNINPD